MEGFTTYKVEIVTPERTCSSRSLDDFKMLTISQTITNCNDSLSSLLGNPDGPKTDNTPPRNIKFWHPLNHKPVNPPFVLFLAEPVIDEFMCPAPRGPLECS